MRLPTASQLLVADNLSDDVLQMDAGTGEIIHRFDVSTGDYVPSAYPCAVVAMPDATAAYVTLWNSPKIVRLDLTKGVISNWIEVSDAKVASSPHPTAMALLGKDGLLVTLSNEDRVAVVDTTFNTVAGYLPTRLPNQTIAGSYPNALAVSANPARIFVADASSDAIAVYDASGIKSVKYVTVELCGSRNKSRLSASSPPTGIPPPSPFTATISSSPPAKAWHRT